MDLTYGILNLRVLPISHVQETSGRTSSKHLLEDGVSWTRNLFGIFHFLGFIL